MPDHPLDPVFVALGDATRREVMQLLSSDGATTATQLAARFPVTRQAITKHLQVLGEAGLVVAERRGRETHWTLRPEQLATAMAWMADLGGGFEDRVAALQRHLGERQTERNVGFRPPLRVAASRRVQRPDPPRRFLLGF